MNPVSEIRIDREWINSLDPIHFGGEIEVVSDRRRVDKVVHHLMQHRELGFDTETRPAFRKGVKHPVALLQLATRDKAYLFQLMRTGLMPSMVELLESAKIRKLGIGLRDDLVKLQERAPFQPKGFVDLSQLAHDKGIVQVGARALVARYLRRRLTKSAQRSNWATPELTERQVNYAATDAWICLKLYPLLLSDSRQYSPREQASE